MVHADMSCSMVFQKSRVGNRPKAEVQSAFPGMVRSVSACAYQREMFPFTQAAHSAFTVLCVFLSGKYNASHFRFLLENGQSQKQFTCRILTAGHLEGSQLRMRRNQ